jgi:hypothetical protein
LPKASPVHRWLPNIRHMWRIAAALAASVALLIALAFLFSLGGGGQKGFSAWSLLADAQAAEGQAFVGNQIVHSTNEIVVVSVEDATLAKIRWLPLASIDASGKPRYDQLALPAEPGKGYTVEDQSWYDPATGRFARVLLSAGKPVFANAFDGKNVYTLEAQAAGGQQIVKQPIAKDFKVPKSPAEFLGIAAGLQYNEADGKNAGMASDAGKTKLADGSEARIVKLALPKPDTKEALDTYWLVTVRMADKRIEKMEWFAEGKLLLEVRRGKAETNQEPNMGWDLAGLTKQLAAATPSGPAVLRDMVLPDVSVEHMVKAADYATYVLSKAPSWAGERQIADILDLPSPPHRMFATTYRAKDGRHVVLVQSYSYNKMLGPLVKVGKLVYTSPDGVKVWSGPQDQWMANLMLTSAQPFIKDRPGKEVTGYMLETPAGTFPVLAVNGKISEQELHGLVDSIVPAK